MNAIHRQLLETLTKVVEERDETTLDLTLYGTFGVEEGFEKSITSSCTTVNLRKAYKS